MPELPEVETIKSQLEVYLPFKIVSVSNSVHASKLIRDKQDFSVRGLTISSIKRHGKFLIFCLDDSQYIISHLGMSGGWRYSESKIEAKHTHIQFKGICNGTTLFFAYVDPRRFGRIFYYNQEHFDEYMVDRGVDISTSNFTLEYLKGLKSSKPNKVLKPFLLDQHFFAGVGNYIASEICARAKLLPTRTMGSLTLNDLKQVLLATQSILNDTIKNGGTTFSGGYADAQGEKGLGVQNLVVFYQKQCGMCKKTEIIKITQQARGTYYCPHCQK